MDPRLPHLHGGGDMQTLSKTRRTALAAMLLFLLSTGMAWCAPGAIVISGIVGPDEPSGRGDINAMTTAFKNTSVGPGINSANILKKEKASQSDLNQLISQANSAGFNPLYLHISGHGYKGTLDLANDTVSSTTLAISIAQSTASKIFISIDACHSGSLVSALKTAMPGRAEIVSSANESTKSDYWQFIDGSDGNGYFTETFAGYLTDPSADANNDGKVSYEEAYNKVKTDTSDKGIKANKGKPVYQSYRDMVIPTLSEWKQIFLTLLMMSLVMGYIRSQSPGLAAVSCGGLQIVPGVWMAFDKRLYLSVLKWTGLVVVSGLSAITAIFGPVSSLDIAGTLCCAPLVAYIVHLAVPSGDAE